MYSVIVEDLEFYGYHGVSREEQAVGHRFRVDASVVVDAELPTSDNVDDTVDYSQLADVIVKIGTQTRYKTVEALVSKMCDEVFDVFPIVSGVQITVAKVLPPFAHVAKSAGVNVGKSRPKVTA